MADSQVKTENLFTGVIEQGTITGQGVDSPATNRIRTAGFTSLTAGIYTLSFTTTDTYVVFIFKYDNNDNFIERIPNDWASIPYTFTLDTACKIRFAIKHPTETTISPQDVSDIILNVGSTALPYWQHSLRKLTTATEAVENPLYSDGTAITAYTIKGNTVQNGTPTPSNPVDVNGVAERTENVYNKYNVINVAGLGTRYGNYVPVGVYSIYNDTDNNVYWGINNMQSRFIACEPHSIATVDMSTQGTSQNYGFMMAYNDASLGDVTIVQGSTAPDHYIPYGYKIPISSGGVTTNIYLGSTQTVRQIKKLVLTGEGNFGRQNISNTDSSFARFSKIFQFGSVTSTSTILYASTHFTGLKSFGTTSSTAENCFEMRFASGTTTMMIVTNVATTATSFNQWLSDQYANGTPVTVWYVLATPETAAVNEPLMKIGTYADTLSNAASISTTEGANSITVDTTVQPSEFTATWTGWHDAMVKEYDGSQWNE